MHTAITITNQLYECNVFRENLGWGGLGGLKSDNFNQSEYNFTATLGSLSEVETIHWHGIDINKFVYYKIRDELLVQSRTLTVQTLKFENE